MDERERTHERFHTSDIFKRGDRVRAPRDTRGTYVEPSREIHVYHRTNVLVVGGGPAGTAAAVAAAREGVDVTLVERYNHLGGLSTGGLVIWIDRMSDWEGNPTIRGFADEVFDRLPADAVAGPPRDEWGSRDPERAWRRSARDARKEIDKLIDRYPSLRSRLQYECTFSYPHAVRVAHDELGDYGEDHESFPTSCPWTRSGR